MTLMIGCFVAGTVLAGEIPADKRELTLNIARSKTYKAYEALGKISPSTYGFKNDREYENDCRFKSDSFYFIECTLTDRLGDTWISAAVMTYRINYIPADQWIEVELTDIHYGEH